MKEFHVLGIDGGGSKGLMEAILLQDVMNAATVIARNPDRVLEIIQASKEDQDNQCGLFCRETMKEQFILEIKGVEDKEAIHPTEVFDMIVGTSVGGLMAFGLVGGNVNDKGEREIMSLQEVVDFMYRKTPNIWQSSPWYSLGIGNNVFGYPAYSSDGLFQILEEQFGKTTLHSIKNKCIAAAVTRSFGKTDIEEDEVFDALDIFDTHAKSKNQLVTDVLKATSNAPVYFQTPIYIDQNAHVDGGIGGNCPMAQGVTRMKELWKKGKFGTGLSIAPPRRDRGKPGGGIWWMTSYFPRRSTDGLAFYSQYKNQHPLGTNQRIYPRSEKARSFKTDDLRVDEMIACMEEEKNSAWYLNEVASAAIVIAARVVKPDDVAKLWEIAKDFVDFEPTTSIGKKLASQKDNYLAVLNAMSKIELDKNSAMRHQILLKKAELQAEAEDYDEAMDTLKKIDLENDNVDEELKKQIQSMLDEIDSIDED